jgi:hypothetical protein
MPREKTIAPISPTCQGSAGLAAISNRIAQPEQTQAEQEKRTLLCSLPCPWSVNFVEGTENVGGILRQVAIEDWGGALGHLHITMAHGINDAASAARPPHHGLGDCDDPLLVGRAQNLVPIAPPVSP